MGARSPRRRAGRSRGQATVELALVLPVVVLALLLVVQVAVVAITQVRVEHAAREAGRAAALGLPPPPGGLDPARTEVVVTSRPPWVTAEVEHRTTTDLPLVGRLVPDLVLTARSTFRVEVVEG